MGVLIEVEITELLQTNTNFIDRVRVRVQQRGIEQNNKYNLFINYNFKL